ncbi:MAG: C10 family peptidase [Bacteroidales bacterium]|nr:C10 family peptidase [Bacteroidales bacterium]
MKRIVLALALIISFNLLFSNPVDTITAKRVAENFYKQNSVIGVRNGQTIRIRRQVPEYVVVPLDTMFTGFYILNSTNDDGFVIVSADNNVMPILGYSDEHSFNASNMPPAMRDWLYGYEMEIRRARIMDRNLVSDEARREWGALLTGQELPNRNINNVAPLLTTNWGQRWPYNLSCPSTTNGNAPTGCVATAMAQVMKYWKYPQTGVGSHTYTHTTYGTLSANFESVIAWNEMLNTYNPTSSYTPMQASAISSLMYMCGVSVEMNYGVTESGANIINGGYSFIPSAETALKTYFDYSNDLHGISKSVWQNNQWVDVYTNSQWMNILKNELDSGRVILYGGSIYNNTKGHAFVCDGYNNNYFHFNWGWSDDGLIHNCYCLITSLIPQNSNNNYTYGQQAIIGISPTNQPIHPNYDLMMYSSLTSSASSYQYGDDVIITGTVTNVGNASFNGYIYAIVSDINGNYATEVQTYANISANQHVTKTFTIPGGLPLAPGQYFVCLTSSSNPNDVNAARFIRDNLSHPNFVSFSVEYETTLETFSDFDVSSEIIYPGQSITVNVDILNAGTTTFSGNVAVAILSSEGSIVQFIQQQNLLSNSLQPNYHFTNGLDFTGTITAPAGDYFLALLWKELSSASWLYAGSGHNHLNPVRVKISEQPLADIYETNNTISTAYSFTPNFTNEEAIIKTGGANFHSQSDEDYYKIVLPSGFRYFAIPCLEDMFYNDDISYSVDAKFYYAINNTTSWIGPIDLDANMGIYISENYYMDINNGGTIYFRVVPSFSGDMGTYSLNVLIGRSLLPDQYEENDNSSNAYLLGSVSSNSATFDVNANFHITTDNDYYKINLPAGYSYTINANILNSYNNSNYTADAKFATSQDGNTWSSNYGNSMPALTISDGGTLYFRVLPYTNNEIGTYSLHIVITRTGGGGSSVEPDMYEPNNTASAAYLLGTITNNSTTLDVNANFHITTDNDYYKIDLPAGYSYTINANILNSYNNSNYTADAKFATSTDGNTWSSNYGNSMSALTMSNGGTLYFRVLPYTNNEMGTYSLHIDISRQGGLEADAYEPNNSVSAAYLLETVNGSNANINAEANFHTSYDVDYYKIIMLPGYSYAVDARLYDSYNDDTHTVDAKFAVSQDGNNWSEYYGVYAPTMTYTNGGRVYYHVIPYQSGTTGTYRLNVEITASNEIEEYGEIPIQLYPNPASDYLYVTIPESMTVNQLDIFNMEGQLIKTVKGNVSSINIAELSKGLYFIRIHTEGEIIVRKFVKR